MNLRPRIPEDLPQVIRLLESVQLPPDGLDRTEGWVIEEGSRILGHVAAEVRPDAAVLRSLVVSPLFQGQGLGRRLWEEAESHFPHHVLALKTETIGPWVQRMGYRKTNLTEVPASLRDTTQFEGTLCASTPVYVKLPAEVSPSCGCSGNRKDSSRAESDPIPNVSTRLSWRDRLGSWKARWNIGRMNFTVSPGLYGAGKPGPNSPVFVTANYKMSFDRLRQSLNGLDAWILVLDTRGINVWCAAGKGTFGTQELVRRIEAVGLPGIVSHRTLILPQLGAPGVAAHQVLKLSGFKVKYGPVRAEDIPAYVEAGFKADEAMRTVRFELLDRLVLAPLEVVNLRGAVTTIAAILFLIQLTGWTTIRWSDLWPFVGAALMGATLVPLLLPWIPGRAFAIKGFIVGLAWALPVALLKPDPVFIRLAYVFALPAITSFLALQFTGASTYTSLSGVLKETRFSMPAIRFAIVLGLVLLVMGRFS